MKIGPHGLAIVKAFESCDRPVPGRPGFFHTYRDEVGVLTIGWGHTNLGNVPPHIADGDVWTQARCDEALANDMDRFTGGVAHIMKGVDLSQYQFDALVSFDFNTGALGRSSIPAKLRAGNVAMAMNTLLQYNRAGGRVLNGLIRRRKAERLLFLGQITAAVRLAGGILPNQGATT